ncbi:type IV secretory system conjugative DNA transfer family protein [Micromonospora sp. NPDC050276]|uniref:type IV secretory system conjugative DNA transfer family protein n=1 Tax=Micromonospora sp. NPDC050276 TaxID=3364278 RepID=UPI00379B8C41
MSGNTTRLGGSLTSGSDWVVGAIVAVAAGTMLGIWLTGQVAGLLALHWPGTSPADAYGIALALPRHLSDPRLAWPPPAQGQLPGPIRFYTAAVLVSGALSTAGVLLWQRWGNGRQARGMASRQQLRRTLSAEAVLRAAPRLRPGLDHKPMLTDVAVPLGDAGSMRLHAGLESSVLLVAPPRQGKTSQVIIPWLRGFPGAAVVTSVRPDVLENTATLRAGTAWVMELTGDLTWPHRIAWSPIAGCGRYDVARKRAGVMIQVGKQESTDATNAGFFGMTATNLMAAWLHTAALTGRTMTDILAWSTDDTNDQPVKLLRDAHGARDGVLKMLDGFYRQPHTTRSNLWATVQTGTSCLFGEAAHHVFAGTVNESFDIEAFLRSGTDTVYLLVDEQQAEALAPLVTAFVDEITTTAKRLALRAPTGRLDPPLGLILDEVTNVVPLPDLPQLMSYAAGSGIFVTAVLQNLAAAEQRWRAVGRRMLWANSTIKIALGGLAGDDLDDFSQLAGTYRETLLVPQRNDRGVTVQTTVTDRKTMSPEAIRTLNEQRREALVIHATTPAVLTRMARHYESRHAKEYADAVRHARTLMGHTPETPR